MLRSGFYIRAPLAIANMSRVEVKGYEPGWVGEFAATAQALRTALGDIAVRIDHIGSTSVPGIAAKPIIDIQVTVAALADADAMVQPMQHLGFIHRPDASDDRPPPWADPVAELWRKDYFRTPEPPLPVTTAANLRTHVHVRERGRPNQRYALLFRDYLRSNDRARDAYGLLKTRLAAAMRHLSGPGDSGLYLNLKDPMLDLIADGAQSWATLHNWTPGPSDN